MSLDIRMSETGLPIVVKRKRGYWALGSGLLPALFIINT